MPQASPIDLGRGWVDGSIRVLAAAFATDPTMRYVCASASPGYERRVLGLYRSLVRYQIAWGEPRLGIVEDERLVAVCHLARPGAREPLRAQLVRLLRLARSPGLGALMRGAAFARATATCHPDTPHYYIVSIGVDPERQGRGYGGALLRTVADLAAGHSKCAGVALDTQNADNVKLYERFGYRVSRADKIGPLDSWCMFRPNASRSDSV